MSGDKGIRIYLTLWTEIIVAVAPIASRRFGIGRSRNTIITPPNLKVQMGRIRPS